MIKHYEYKIINEILCFLVVCVQLLFKPALTASRRIVEIKLNFQLYFCAIYN